MAKPVPTIENSNNSHLKLVLRLIEVGTNLSALRKYGLRYSQISRLLSIAHEEGFLELQNSSLRITDAGINYLRTTEGGGTIGRTVRGLNR